ncbi:hypothetical protein BTN49_1197 [Candidatus Enterovibrio escicola]|uniref:Uncharacterized protein n=1 Tax=Candidatus Enterovibrio escicola TaxID=1927127 RepID=A0A2A5T4X9_9GAMM|nr:hypothetical protein BTN49_1197 [Candidatus Enterovibrio escacola]
MALFPKYLNSSQFLQLDRHGVRREMMMGKGKAKHQTHDQ